MTPMDYICLQCHVIPLCCHRSYRVIHGVDYLNHFSSDRSHMQREDGSWIAPPPTYKCILENLSLTSSVYGTVLSESEFFKKFSGV
ncbi:unnamed protein product [Schistosoma margrebowiei]|uniref:Protein N-terminal glutamine amidohydrolase n=1 Tax=Schistosoma margrebowiei TaxID=48269 RepID=A0A183M0D5_9TREM|nr:unnamed protein product [Schistosoma margrebowiei]